MKKIESFLTNKFHLILLCLLIPYWGISQNDYQKFQRENPDWKLSLHPETEQINSAYGKAVVLNDFSTITNENVEQACLAFMQKYPLLFNMPLEEMALKGIQNYNGKFYVFFEQSINEVKVVDSKLNFVIHETGKVMAFGMNWFYADETESRAPKNQLSSGGIITTVHATFPSENYNVTAKNINARDSYVVVSRNGLRELVRCREFIVEGRSVAQKELIFVDVSSGAIVKRVNQIFDYSKNVTGLVKPRLVGDDNRAVAIPYLNLTINGNEYTTNSEGVIDDLQEAESYEVTTQLRGTYIKMTGVSETGSTDENTGNITLTDESRLGERNIFYHANKAREIITSVDPNFTAINVCFSASISSSSHCNAYYNRRANENEVGNFVFHTAGSVGSYSCHDFALSPSVIYHEYGHAINDYIFIQLGQEGMNNETCQEGLADLFSALILDESEVGRDVYIDGAEQRIRNLDNSLRYPEDFRKTDGHYSGQILSGAFWDIKKAIGKDAVARLSHFAKYAMPDDVNTRLAFSEWFLATMIADDNDGDLSTLSSNQNIIIDAFNAHGIGTDLYLSNSFEHTRIANTEDTENSYQGVFRFNAVGATDLNDITIVYTKDHFETNNELHPEKTENGYRFNIPAQEEGSLVEYYFKILDRKTGKTLTFPEGYPDSAQPYKFLVGFTQLFIDDFSTNRGWTFESTTDAPWVIGVPEHETMSDNGGRVTLTLQPVGDRHSETGQCLFTGDNGKLATHNNSVISPLFDCSGNSKVVVSYYDWFFAHKDTGTYSFYISNDGGTNWTLIQELESEARVWENQFFELGNYVTGDFSQIKFKFVTNGEGATMNALIDDFELLGLRIPTNINQKELAEQINIAPNPVKDICYLNVSGYKSSVAKIEVYDTYGRLLESIEGNALQGESRISIDTKDYKSQLLFVVVTFDNGVKRRLKLLKI
ncbi:hypothetical protein EMN47_02335 [Prolixibacteraceae bacterium JC049]|nr:hypothetical protein [Prolixibacteraceae bacterium JC049]